MLKFLIVDDHEAVSLGVSLMIEDIIPIHETDTSNSLFKTLESLRNKRYDMLILDLNIPGGNNINMIQQILAVQRDLKIMIFSAYPEESYAVSYIKAGVKGYVSKLCATREFHKAVQTVLDGKVYTSTKLREALLNTALDLNENSDVSHAVSKLSPRELEVMDYLVAGKSTSEIAHKLNLALPTVSIYRNRIYEKLNVSNVIDLIKKVWDINNLTENID